MRFLTNSGFHSRLKARAISEKEPFSGRSEARDQPELPTSHMLPSKQVHTHPCVFLLIGIGGDKQNEDQLPLAFNMCQTRWNLSSQLLDG